MADHRERSWDFGFGVQLVRAFLGLGQTEFAKAVGVSSASVTLWIQGKRTPREDAVARICELADIAPWDFHALCARRPDARCIEYAGSALTGLWKRSTQRRGRRG